MIINNIEVKADCIYFKGSIPCIPHKKYNVHCDNCEYYDKITEKILIIKLGAIGDVIRTTPLLHKLWEMHPNAQIWWITEYPEIIPKKVDRILEFNFKNTLLLQSLKFDKVINLDKDYEACALSNHIIATKKYGFVLDESTPAPADYNAEHKFMTGIFDDYNKANKKSYPQEIFEICGWEFSKEEYILDKVKNEFKLNNMGRKIIGLNTGCGDRWVTRLWSEDRWVELAIMLRNEGYHPLILGGSLEHEKNLRIQKFSGADYQGHFSLNKFISLIDLCDVVVTAVTMAMHIAIAQKKQLILMNNIFNPYEFELYNRGEILMPDKECKCFFLQKCENDEYFCMDHLPVDKVLNAIKRSV